MKTARAWARGLVALALLRGVPVTQAALAQPAPPAARVVTILATGDVLVHRRVTEVARAHQAEGGFAWVLAPIAALLPETDIAFANLETPLSERHRRVGNGPPPVLGAPPGLARALSVTGFDVVSLANNHAFDQTGDGLAETLDALSTVALQAVGAGRSLEAARAPVVLERHGVRVAFLATTGRLNCGPGHDPPEARVFVLEPVALTAALAEARRLADVVVLSIHWSHDFALHPSAGQRALARDLVQAGADVVLGTGPHVLHAVERLPSSRGEAVVAYSLGNLVSNQGARYHPGEAITDEDRRAAGHTPFARDGVLLRLRLEVPAAGTVRVAALEGTPLWTENHAGADGGVVRVQPLAATSAATQACRRPAIMAALGPAVRLQP